jgi:hypothetical protein
MGHEYKITCPPLNASQLDRLRLRLPSASSPSSDWAIYSFETLPDGIYFVDHLVDASTASNALRVLIDTALAGADSISISEP